MEDLISMNINGNEIKIDNSTDYKDFSFENEEFEKRILITIMGPEKNIRFNNVQLKEREAKLLIEFLNQFNEKKEE